MIPGSGNTHTVSAILDLSQTGSARTRELGKYRKLSARVCPIFCACLCSNKLSSVFEYKYFPPGMNSSWIIAGDEVSCFLAVVVVIDTGS